MIVVKKIKDLAMHPRRRRPILGIVPSFDEATFLPSAPKSLFLRRSYVEMITSVGAIPFVILPDMPIREVMSICEGIVISGGEDLDPAYYGKEYFAVPGAHREPNERYEWQQQLLSHCDAKSMPVLGICYGMQSMNVYYGGTLIQDIDTELPENVGHNKTLHDVVFERDFLGFHAGQRHTVNSRHHQAVDTIANGFEVTARADDGIIEAMQRGNHFGIQWHPESDETGAHVYRSFVEICAPRVA